MKTVLAMALLVACAEKDTSRDQGDGGGQDGVSLDGVAGQYQLIPAAATGCTVGEGDESVPAGADVKEGPHCIVSYTMLPDKQERVALSQLRPAWIFHRGEPTAEPHWTLDLELYEV